MRKKKGTKQKKYKFKGWEKIKLKFTPIALSSIMERSKLKSWVKFPHIFHFLPGSSFTRGMYMTKRWTEDTCCQECISESSLRPLCSTWPRLLWRLSPHWQAGTWNAASPPARGDKHRCLPPSLLTQTPFLKSLSCVNSNTHGVQSPLKSGPEVYNQALKLCSPQHKPCALPHY